MAPQDDAAAAAAPPVAAAGGPVCGAASAQPHTICSASQRRQHWPGPQHRCPRCRQRRAPHPVPRPQGHESGAQRDGRPAASFTLTGQGHARTGPPTLLITAVPSREQLSGQCARRAIPRQRSRQRCSSEPASQALAATAGHSSASAPAAASAWVTASSKVQARPCSHSRRKKTRGTLVHHGQGVPAWGAAGAPKAGSTPASASSTCFGTSAASEARSERTPPPPRGSAEGWLSGATSPRCGPPNQLS